MRRGRASLRGFVHLYYIPPISSNLATRSLFSFSRRFLLRFPLSLFHEINGLVHARVTTIARLQL